MRLNRSGRIALAVLTIWSPLFLVVFLGWLALAPVLSLSGKAPEYPKDQIVELAVEVAAAVVSGAITALIYAFTTVFYAVHITKNDALTVRSKTGWFLACLAVGALAMPFYGYRYVFGRGAPPGRARPTAG